MANELDELEALTQASTQAPQATGAAPAPASGNSELDQLSNLTHAEDDAVTKAADDDNFDETDYYRKNGKTEDALNFAVKVRQAKEAKPAEPLKAAGSFVKGVGEELGKTGEDIWEGGKAIFTGKPHEAKSGLGSFVGGMGKAVGNLINSQDDPAGISKGKMMNGDEWLKETKARIDRYDRLKELQAEERQNFLKAGGNIQDFKSQIGILPEEEVSPEERAAYDRHAAAALESSAAIHLGAYHGANLAIKGWRGLTEWDRKDWTPEQWKNRIQTDAELRDTADTIKSGKLPDVEKDGLQGMSRLSAMITPEVPDDVRQRLTREGTYKPEDVEQMSGIADPTNLLLGEGLRLPIVAKAGGAALRLSGTGMKAVGSVADKMIGHGAGRGIALAGGGVVAYKVGEGVMHGDFKPLGVALALFGARSLLRRGGALVDDAGRELLNPEGFNSASATRAAGALAEDAAAGTGPTTPMQGALGNFLDGSQNAAAASRIARRTLQGATIGVEGALPFAALSDNPEQAGHSIGGGAAFGGVLGPIGGIEPTLNRAMEINKAATSILAERGGAQTFSDPALQKAHNAAMADLPTGYQTYLNAMRGLVSGFRGRAGEPMKIAVLDAPEFGKQVAARSGAAPDAAATAHGYYDANSGTVFINKEGLRSRTDAAGHETGHFITDEVMAQMGRAYGDALRTAAEKGLFNGDKPTPEFQRFIDEYNKKTPGAPIPSDKGKADILRHRAVSEYLAETTRGILGEPNLGRFMLPKDVSDMVADRLVAMYGDEAGGGPKQDIFKRTDLPTIHAALKDVVFDLGRGLTPPARPTGSPRPGATAGAGTPQAVPVATGSAQPATGPQPGAGSPNPTMPQSPAVDPAEPHADIGVTQDTLDSVRDYHISPPGMEPRTQRANRRRGIDGKSADKIAEERGNEWDEMFSNYAEFLRTNGLQAPSNPTALHQAVIEHALSSDPVARAHAEAVRNTPAPAAPEPAPAGALSEPEPASSIKSKSEGALADREPEAAPEAAPERETTTAVTEHEITNRLADAEKEAQADPSFTRKRQKGKDAALRTARINALLDISSESSGGDQGLLQRRTDAGGQERFTGRLDPENIPAHRMLLDELGVNKDGQATIDLLNNHVGQTVYLDYKSAPKTTEGDITGEQRRKEYQESTADDRKAGGDHVEQKGKAFHITGFKVWPGKGSITLTGFSPDKWIANAHKLMEHVRAEGQDPGYTGVNDPHLATDMQGYAENHANGYKGDGSGPVEGRDPAPGYTPWEIPKDRFNLLNAALNFDISNKADSARPGARENAMEAQYRALDNGITPDEETGDVNPLRAFINKSGKLVSTNADGKTREGTGAHLENVYESISPDLVTGLSITPDGQNIVRPVGFKGDPADVARQGIPRADYAASGFMPMSGEKGEFMPHDDAPEKIRPAISQMREAAQKVYDAWDQSDPEHGDPELGFGGICQDIAEEISGVLGEHGIESATVDNNGMGEQHVWVIAKLPDGVYEVDIHPSVYETGGGYTWKKIPGVKFSDDDISIYRMDKDPEKFDEYAGNEDGGWMPNEGASSIKSKGALADEKETQAQYAARLKNDPASLIEEHRNAAGVPVLNGDAIIYNSPEFKSASKEEAPMVAKKLYPMAKEARDAALDHLVEQPIEGDGAALVMAGGIGSGKSTISKRLEVPEFIYDTNLKSFDDARRNIDAILKSGRKVRIALVEREPGDAMRANLRRFQDEGRIEYADDVGGSNAQARANVKKLAEHYADNENVNVKAYRNVHGQDPVEIPLKDVEDLSVDAARKRAHDTLNEIENGTDQGWDRPPLTKEAIAIARGNVEGDGRGLSQGNNGARGVLSDEGQAPGAKAGGSTRGALADAAEGTEGRTESAKGGARGDGLVDGPDGSKWKMKYSRAKAGDEVVMVDVSKFDEAFKKDGPGFYIPKEGGGGEIKGRIPAFKEWRKKGEPIEMPEVHVSEDGTASFVNGRHRYATFRDEGAKFIPVAMEPEAAAAARANGLEYTGSFMPDEMPSSIKTKIDELTEKHKGNLAASVSFDARKGVLKLDSLNAKKDAPKGTGTAFMEDLTKFADENGLTIALTTADKGDMGTPGFKATSSTNRLKNFYGRFGFQSNYGKRTYRADLPGNMHRPPAGEFMPGERPGRLGQDPEDFNGTAPDVNWNASDVQAGVWNRKSVSNFLTVPADDHVYKGMVDLHELEPVRAEKESAKEMREGKEDPSPESMKEAEGILEDYTNPDNADDFKYSGHRYEEYKDFLPWDNEAGYDEKDVKDLAREIEARANEGSYDESEFERGTQSSGGYPPVVITRKVDGTLVLNDGNHRVDTWQNAGRYDLAPAWINDEAGRAVAKAADAAGYKIEAAHSTNSPDFATFKTDGVGAHFGTEEAAMDRAEHLRSFSEDVVGRQHAPARVLPVRLKIENPLRLPDLADLHETERGEIVPIEEAREAWLDKMSEEDRDAWEHPDQYLPDKEGGDVREELQEQYGDEPRPMAWESDTDFSTVLRDKGILKGDDFWDAQYDPRKAVELLKEKGYDGIVYKNAVEGVGSDSYVIFDPNQVKLADPVLKDASGKVIPPEKRFDSSKDDIHFMPNPDPVDTAGAVDPKDKKAAKKAWLSKGTDSPWFKRWFGESKVVDDSGKPLEVFSGHSNVALYGDAFDPKKATAGAYYATEAPDIASNYANGKIGIRENYEHGSQYRIAGANGKFNKKIWQIQLTPEQVQKARDFLNDEEVAVGHDLEDYWKQNAPYGAEYRRRQMRGLKDLQSIHDQLEEWGYTLRQGERDDARNEEGERKPEFLAQGSSVFEDLMTKLGIKWNSFDFAQPGVQKIFLKIENPIDASKPFPPDLMAALKEVASKKRSKPFDVSKTWTRDYPIKDWVKDIEEGNEYWTTHIPKDALPIIKRMGYDGIKELGLKGVEDRAKRQINWIAFDPGQIKSAIGNRGTFDESEPSMLFMPKTGGALSGASRTPKAAPRRLVGALAGGDDDED